uniref:Uncharacterized protein n=1 Tax=Setaria italica TaxID=4555 RepID=K3XP52_SETIT
MLLHRNVTLSHTLWRCITYAFLQTRKRPETRLVITISKGRNNCRMYTFQCLALQLSLCYC